MEIAMITHFNYWLIGTGWAEVYFSSASLNIKFEFSYISDPISELFQGLKRLINNKSDLERIIFPEEPGEHSLVISRTEKDLIKVEIFRSDEWEAIGSAYNNDNEKEIVFSGTDTLKNFVFVVCTGIDNLLERHTLTEYKEKWGSQFPLEHYEELKKGIRQMPL